MSNFEKTKHNNPLKGLCTAVITPDQGLMLKMPDGTLIPGVRKIQLNDDYDEVTTCTITLIVNTSEL